MICTSIQNSGYSEILGLLAAPQTEMAEIRLDSCTLSDEEIQDLFANSDVPLVATCRISPALPATECERRLRLAIEAGARFADLEIEAPAPMSKNFQKLCRHNGTELIRSYHNFECTPDDEELQKALARCFRYGADIAKVVTTCNSDEDASRIEVLYSLVLEGVPSMQGRLIAFAMGEKGRETRMECLRRGAPFSYACTSSEQATAPGQWTTKEMFKRLYSTDENAGDCRYNARRMRMPASKSFAQRAIIAAALAEGTSHLGGYSPCDDSEAAIELARRLGAKVDISEDGSLLTIKGIGPVKPGCLEGLDSLETGESGLLTRLMIPLAAVLGPGEFTINGRGSLLRRPLASASDIMAAFGVLVAGLEKHANHEVYIPAKVSGRLIPGRADIPGSGGSQLISGLLMTLPLCGSDSELHVNEPKSLPYMYITLDVLKRFGVKTRSEMEGDAELLETGDWSECSGVLFKIRGGQRYSAANFEIESDWSAAANFLVAGAVFGSVEINGLDMQSLQADLSIIDVLVDAGAVVSQLEDGCVSVRKAPLEAFEEDLNHAPDLFPIVAVLAAFCAGESRIHGVGRLVSKESDRASAIVEMLTKMGVEASIEGDTMTVCGESLSSRLLNGRLLKGGDYTSRHDHRMVMALKIASIGADSPVVIDDEACVAKSFPEFLELFDEEITV